MAMDTAMDLFSKKKRFLELTVFREVLSLATEGSADMCTSNYSNATILFIIFITTHIMSSIGLRTGLFRNGKVKPHPDSIMNISRTTQYQRETG